MSRRRPRRPGRPRGRAATPSRRDPAGTPAWTAGGHARQESWPDGEWMVRSVTGSASTKPYRCPGCDQTIRPATPHVVAWPVEPTSFTGSGLDERRHWHAACWLARQRRGSR